MAINLAAEYPGKTTVPNAQYPFGGARNVTTPGDGTGTPWEQAIVNDFVGFLQSALTDAGVTPSGAPDTATAPQYLESLKRAILTPVNGVQGIPSFVGKKAKETLILKSWFDGGVVGGGVLLWDATKLKSEHNGGTVFSPTVPFNNATDYRDAVGETDPVGTGAWVRISVGSVVPEEFGFNTNDELQSFLAADGDQYIHRQYGRMALINGRDDTAGLFDAPNFAGQTDGPSAPIGFVFHHYTDGGFAQYDNVGDGDTITLKLANNPTRRPDKPANYVGTGKHISFNRVNSGSLLNEEWGYIDKDFKFVWTGVGGIATLWQNKAEDGTPAFREQTSDKHIILSDFFNGLADVVYRFKNDVGFSRFTIEVDASQANGMLIETKAGNIRLVPAGGKVEFAGTMQATTGNTVLGAPAGGSVETQVPLKPRDYVNLAGLPAPGSYDKTMAFANGVPVYSDGTDWRNVSDNSLVV